MAQADASSNLGDFYESLLNRALHFLRARISDPLGDSSQFGIAHTVRAASQHRGAFFESLEVGTLLVVLEQIHLLGKADHESVNGLIEIRAGAEDRVDGSSAKLVHAVRIGEQERGL